MQFQQILLSIVALLSVIGLGRAAHTQQIKVAAEQFQVQNAAPVTQPQEKLSDVPYVPTPSKVVEEMLNVAGVTGNDILYDLGSGDGRIVITAAQKFGTQGVGIDINPKLIQDAFNNAQKAGVTDRVQFIQQDLFKTDLSKASVVTLYLLRSVNLKLRPKLLKELKPGTRIVSHSFDMGDWEPDRVVIVENEARKHVLYYWVVPETIPDHLK